MKLFRLSLGAVVLAGGMASAPAAMADDLTLCWAAWDPANALVELSKEIRSRKRSQHELRIHSLAQFR